ncbi:hypothetical protein GGS24DRAFT_515232 [Hypoxylon argillaceum]|nr:hypothetical protein GGS24DRAFT_515232 [Hypoxylon argillaceum]
MSQDDRGRGGRDNNRERPNNNSGQDDNRQKRRRSPTPDFDNSRDRHTRRRYVFGREQMHQVEFMYQGQRLTASHSLDPRMLLDCRFYEQTTEELVPWLRAFPNSLWAVVCPRGIGSQPIVEEAFEAGPIANKTKKSPKPDTECDICYSDTHLAQDCAKLGDDVSEDKRTTGFKKWCPHHKKKNHTMDECRERWTWLRDINLVKKYLITDCISGPAFATNLIDWRCLLDLGNFRTYKDCPWTPEFATKQAIMDRDFHERTVRKIDPSTSTSGARSVLDHQTENGEPPQFATYADLRAHAEAECAKAAAIQQAQAIYPQVVELYNAQRTIQAEIDGLINSNDNPVLRRMYKALRDDLPLVRQGNDASAEQGPNVEAESNNGAEM